MKHLLLTKSLTILLCYGSLIAYIWLGKIEFAVVAIFLILVLIKDEIAT